MMKRRRERDRPKASHDALYNPNKRVMLSYMSDEDIEDGVKAEARNAPGTNSDAQNDYQDLAEAEDLDVAPGNDESLHRELFEEAWQEDDLDEEEMEEEDDEKDEEGDANGATNGNSLWARGIRKNTHTGQWAALGSLAYQWDDEDGQGDEEFDTEEEEAMSYLRAVRSERQSMPMVFKAANTYTQEEVYESGEGDTRGYYEDGAYVGRASLGPQLPPAEKVSIDPQEAFTRVLVQRFRKERERMHLPPDPEALAALDTNHPISFPAKSNKAYAEWHRLVRTTVPLPAQIRAMQGFEVFRLVELIQKTYLVRNTDIVANVSTWIWSLLARLDDVGTMDNDQVWNLRELGRRAVLMQVSFSDPEAAEELERVAVEESNEEKNSSQLPSLRSSESRKNIAELENGDASVEQGAYLKKAEELAQCRQNTQATLDMIIVLVGEAFGQRDLLEFRKSWADEEKLSSG